MLGGAKQGAFRLKMAVIAGLRGWIDAGFLGSPGRRHNNRGGYVMRDMR